MGDTSGGRRLEEALLRNFNIVAPKGASGERPGDPIWTIFGRSRDVPLYVTLHVTQANLDLDVISRAKTRGIDATQ